ncbi:MAG: CHC2 zinc finger protein [Siphoviridae sp. cttb18]|nr:MAG: CHC2 zinc finger protein [Siphoviridae sp. cttb18]
MQNLYFAIRNIPGWLRLLEMAGFDIAKFEVLDEAIRKYDKAWDNYYKRHVVPEQKREEFEFIREIHREMPDEIIAIKEEQKEGLMAQLSAVLNGYEEAIWKGTPAWLAGVVKELGEPKKLMRQIRKLQTDIDFLRSRKEIDLGISDADIVRAKEYPFDTLIDVKRGFAVCPFHNEKTGSFYIRKNFGYCFGCQWNGDTIAFVMETKKVNFVEAIKMLT